MASQLTRPTLFPLAVIAITVLSACQTPPQERAAPTPELQLLAAAPLELAGGCTASGSFVVEFIVDALGRTTDIERPAGPPCLQEALTAWVASFRYSPPATPLAGSVEWLLVSAKKGS